MAITYHPGARGVPGFQIYITGTDLVARGTVIPAAVMTDDTGAVIGTAANPIRTSPGTLGPQTSANSQSVTPATDAVFPVNATSITLIARRASTAATGGAELLSGAARNLLDFSGQNTTVTPLYINFYDKASGAPVLGTDTPRYTYPVPAMGYFSHTFPMGGLNFATGLGITITTDSITIPTTGAAAGAVLALAVMYKA